MNFCNDRDHSFVEHLHFCFMTLSHALHISMKILHPSLQGNVVGVVTTGTIATRSGIGFVVIPFLTEESHGCVCVCVCVYLFVFVRECFFFLSCCLSLCCCVNKVYILREPTMSHKLEMNVLVLV